MHLIVTRSFPPEVGGMQNLMWGLANSISKYNLTKVFADYHNKQEEFDSPHIKFCIPPSSGGKDLVTTKYINY